MHFITRVLTIAVLPLILATSALRAQTPADPSGHWEGAIQAPSMEIRIDVDIARNAKGEFSGALTNPSRNIKGLPFAQVTVKGQAVAFFARTDQGFQGTLSADGKSLSGEFSGPQGTVAFSLARTGPAKITPAPKSPAISKALAGTWNGTLDAGMPLHFVLTMANQADGMATGSLVNLDQGHLKTPLAITEKAAKVTLDIACIGASFSGTLNAAGTELTGTWTQGTVTGPLTFKRDAK